MATLELSIQDEEVAAPVGPKRKLGLLFWIASVWVAIDRLDGDGRKNQSRITVPSRSLTADCSSWRARPHCAGLG